MFIVIEGPDASGKSTITKALADVLSGMYPDRKVSTIRAPGGSAFGESLREFIINKAHSQSPTVLLHLFMASRYELNEEIKQRLSNNEIVICDRYHLSTMVFQSGAQGIDECIELSLKDLSPTYTVLLNAAPMVIYNRLKERGELNNNTLDPVTYEEVRELTDRYVYAYHLRLEKGDKIAWFDSNDSVDIVLNRILLKLRD